MKVCTPKLGTEQPNRTEGMPGTPDEASQGQADQPCDGGLGESAQAQPSQPALPSTSQGQPASQPTQQRGRRGWESEDKNAPPFPWENLVRLREDKRKDAIEYLVARDDPFCVFCSGDIVKRPDGKWETDIDHMDRNTRNNKRWNLRLAHHGCNSTDGNNLRQGQPAPTLPRESVSVSRAGVGVSEGKVGSDLYPGLVNDLVARHETQRARFDEWIDDNENGPFHDVGAFILKSALAKMAVHACGMGSSICYSADTYVLTEDGWKLHSEWSGERIVVFDPPSCQLRLEMPQAFVRHDYSGSMIHFRANCIDMLVTPNHRMLVSTAKTKMPRSKKRINRKFRSYLMRQDGDKARSYWRVLEAADLANYKEWQMFVASDNWLGEEVPKLVLPVNLHGHVTQQLLQVSGDPLLQTIGYYATEGSHSGHKSIRISQDMNSQSIGRMEAAFRAMPFHVSRFESFRPPNDKCRKASHMANFVIYSKPFYDWVSTNCGTSAKEKRLPASYKNLSVRELRVLFDAMMSGDGSWNYTKRSGYFATSSRQLSLDCLEIATKIGYSAYADSGWHPPTSFGSKPTFMFRIYFTKRVTRTFARRAKTNTIKIVPYEGKVYCFKTSTGFYVTMRNGRVAIQGNTYNRYIEEDHYGTKPGSLGRLEIFPQDGKEFVRYRGSRKYIKKEQSDTQADTPQSRLDSKDAT